MRQKERDNKREKGIEITRERKREREIKRKNDCSQIS